MTLHDSTTTGSSTFVHIVTTFFQPPVSTISDGAASDDDDAEEGPLMSLTTFVFLDRCLSLVLVLVSAFGVFTTGTCVAVYLKQGFKDSVTVTFFALSVSDFGTVFLSLFVIIFAFYDKVRPDLALDGSNIAFAIFAYPRGLCYGVSTWLTVMLAVERCLCVVIPFRVSRIFTKTTTTCLIVLIVVFNMSFYVPAFATQQLYWGWDRTWNKTRLLLRFTGNRREIDLALDTTIGVVVPTVAQVVITSCTVVLINGLRRSAHFRTTNTRSDETRTVRPGASETNRENGSSRTNPRDSSGNDADMTRSDSAKQVYDFAEKNILSPKETRVMKTVVFIAVVFIACNLPVILISYVRGFVHELSFMGSYVYLYILVYRSIYIAGSVNATVNLFIYLNVSASFRQTFREMFCSSNENSKENK